MIKWETQKRKIILKLAYDNQIYDNGEIDIKSFAPSLLSFGEIIGEINTALNGKDIILKTSINANFKQKCFQCELILNSINILHDLQSGLGFIKDIDIKEILKLAGFYSFEYSKEISVSVISSYIIWLITSKNKKIESESKLTNGNTQVILKDIETNITTTHEVSINLFALIKYTYKNNKSRKKINDAYKEHFKPQGNLIYEVNNEKSIINANIKNEIINIPDNENIQEKQEIISTDLIIRQPDLLGNQAWTFNFLGDTISANFSNDIKNKIDNIRKNCNFKQGVSLPVKMAIIYSVDIDDKPINNFKKYIILELLGEPKPPDEQLSFNNL